MEKRIAKDVDEYIGWFEEKQQERLQEIRELIRETVPEAEECISYRMPAYRYKGILVYFGAFQKHFSFFPGGILNNPTWASLLEGYKLSKGTLQIPYEKALPKQVIVEILLERKLQNEMKTRGRKR
ncbi:DUF1801 domain-containing protein [Marinilongibacter aquaticus]|uniref:iron chaperone n=1 Tax=Marinilongibacter aquaticus TaxID=2975157 RepID=UPI0021BD6B6C|nr:DUF1801 domain-containing protein [Marinilongibacter aquaticus]UBM57430.1 DUF1801 domain-containing protein [Marinilongibacter aquaticus]